MDFPLKQFIKTIYQVHGPDEMISHNANACNKFTKGPDVSQD